MPVLYIASDQPRSGKTALASSLAGQMARAGRRVAYFKPLSSTPENDPDVQFVGGTVLSDGGPPPQPLPLPEAGDPLLEEGMPEPDTQRITASLEELGESTDLVVVEGPSLSMSPGRDGSWAVQLAEVLDGGVLLVVRYTKDLSGDTVLRLCELFGQRLVGVLVNLVTRYKERDVRLKIAPEVRASGFDFLGAIPEDRTMLSVTVGQIAEHLGGRWVLGEDRSHDLVENLLIGGNVMDSGAIYFGRKESKAVIVRGDRPDIQLAALSAPTACLVLTGGHEPIQYVYHQAEQQDVPLLVVEQDTLSTAQALDTLQDRSTFHHARKVERFQELLGRGADVTSIGVMGL